MHLVLATIVTWLWLSAALLTALVSADAFVPFHSVTSLLRNNNHKYNNLHKNDYNNNLDNNRGQSNPLEVLKASASASASSNDDNDMANDGNLDIVDDDNDQDNLPSSIPRGGGVNNNVHKSPPPLPTFTEYRNFALPCLGLWVASPLLSLVDTGFVGLSGLPSESASNLAALGPATTFFDGATYLFAFLNVATTNLYSTACAKFGSNSDEAESVVQTASRIALRCGLGLMFFLWAFARPLLALYIGHEVDSSPGLLDAAVDYVQIRAFSMPTSLLLGVVQAALLGAKDSVTPLVAILYSTIVNVCGDYLLVKQLGMGLRGAAIATTAAQWAATIALLGPARKRLVRDGTLHMWKKKKPTTTKHSTKQTSTNNDSVNGKTFLGFAAPVLTLILGKLAAFGFMTHSAAAVPGQPTPLAAHQIILSLFFFVSPFMEVVSQTAQTFMPPFLAPAMDRIAQKSKSDKKYQPSRDTIVQPWWNAAFSVGNTLLGLGFVMASVVASIASIIPAKFGGMLTSDGAVKAAVQPLAKYLWAGAFLTAPVAVSEGILLARRELGYLATVYVLTTALLPPALIRVKLMGGNVEQVWACFAAFQLFRAFFFAGRIWLGTAWNAISNIVGKGNTTTSTNTKKRAA
ncbi:MATE efflux family protein [Nitzschia inconspicua]|uniref:MATE efflux family protein n=1 Tax=Nitzschia inconspicua TaxID=303405 RepID=A0A9K3LNU9_9STRA|nr:MATE efflux family protein [Nitzschia inconspicua]KAG7365738.1 MATE efflux family protein [Nitzschia inconspicua]